MDDGAGQKTKVLAKHIPVSVGLCSSHERLAPVFLANPDPKQLINEFLWCLLLLRKRMLIDLFEKYMGVFSCLVELIIYHKLLHI